MSATSLEYALLGRTGTLAWGPTLFRAMLVFHGASLVVLGVLIQRGWRPSPPLPRARRSDQSRTAWIVAGLLCSAALVLRLWRLDTDLWLDELLTLTDFLRMPLGEIIAKFPSQNQHPLYSILGRISVLIFGEDAAAARLPAALFGVASIWALFLLGRRVYNVREALIACALMTFSYHHVWFSQTHAGTPDCCSLASLRRGSGSKLWSAGQSAAFGRAMPSASGSACGST